MRLFEQLLENMQRGGPGSGHFGHKGVKGGGRGGSAPGGGESSGTVPPNPESFAEGRDRLKAEREAAREARRNQPVPDRLKPLAEYMDIQDIDSDTVQKHLRELAGLSEKAIAGLIEKGVVFYLGDKSMVRLNNNQRLNGVRPRGWPAGSTWNKVAGSYNVENKVVTAGRGEGAGESSLIGHETGHALMMTGIISKEAIAKIVSVRKGNIRKLDPYFRQRDPAGLEEFVASSVAYGVTPDKLQFEPEGSRAIFARAIDVLKEDGIL